MHQNYKIEGAEHPVGSDKSFLSDPNYFPEFQTRLEDFKKLVLKKNLKTVGKRALRLVDNLALGGAVSKTVDNSEHSASGEIPVL